jgi:hypothetical protein
VQRDFDYSLYNDNALGFLKHQIDTNRAKPKFIFVHFYTPHVGATELSNKLPFPQSFHNLVADANKYVTRSANYLLAHDSSASIIIMSDHGFREHFLADSTRHENILWFRHTNIDTTDINNNGIVNIGKYLLN